MSNTETQTALHSCVHLTVPYCQTFLVLEWQVTPCCAMLLLHCPQVLLMATRAAAVRRGRMRRRLVGWVSKAVTVESVLTRCMPSAAVHAEPER